MPELESDPAIERYIMPLTRFVAVREPGPATEYPVSEIAQHPERAARIFQQLIPDDGREHIWALFTDVSNTVIGACELAVGAVDRAAIYPSVVARFALLANAKAVILGHNHPTGKVEPSPEDLALTVAVQQALGAIGITLSDHIVMSHESAVFTSCLQLGHLLK